MRNYELTYVDGKGNTKSFIGTDRSAQEVVNYFRGWCGEHDKILLVERIANNGVRIECKEWK